MATTRYALLAFFSFSSLFFFYKFRRARSLRLETLTKSSSTRRGKILYASRTGTCEALARRLHGLISSERLNFDLVNARNYEPEDLQKESAVLLVTSTWEEGKPPPEAEFLARWLGESADDFRVGSMLLDRCEFAVFGVGSRSYDESYNAAARDFSRWMRALGAVEMISVGEGDVDAGDLDLVFDKWSKKVVRVLKGDELVRGTQLFELEKCVVEGSEEEYESEEEAVEDAVVDLEDIAGRAPSRKVSGVSRNEVSNGRNGMKEMVTPVIRANLEKQVSSEDAIR